MKDKRMTLEHIDRFIQRIDKACSLEEILKALQEQVDAYGFGKLTYWLRMPNPELRKPIFLTTYPDKFIEHYIESDYQTHDMVGRFSNEKNTPFVWDDIAKELIITDVQKKLFDESRSVGLQSGGSIPIHGPNQIKAIFSIANDSNAEAFKKLFLYHRHELQILATYAHEKIINIEFDNPFKKINLTSREIEILTWVARGKTYWEVGIILSIQEDTVKKHMSNIFKELQVSNNSHAVSKAVIHGLISP